MKQYFEKNDDLKNELKENVVSINNHSFFFYTNNGLFNKKGLDLGTKILLENFDYKNKKTFLDMGCGCGPIGIYLSTLSKNNTIDMVDINENAVELTKKSLRKNSLINANAFVSNGFSKIKNKYDAILLNPPIHAGKKVIYKIIKDSKEHLNNSGELWIVIRKKHGAESLIKDFSNIFNAEILCKDHGFWIIKFY